MTRPAPRPASPGQGARLRRRAAAVLMAAAFACPGAAAAQDPARDRWDAAAWGPEAAARVGPENCVPAPPPAAAACYGGAVRRYGHDVLGPTPEWSRILLRFSSGETAFAELPAPAVFEDLAPRPLPLPDGRLALVAVESAPGVGARLALWVLERAANGTPRLARLAAAPPIGRGFRWLAPAGWGDLDGDGAVEIAWVETPHLRGILRVFRLQGDALVPVAARAGFSNHRIGEDRIAGAVAPCGDGAALILPDLSHERVMRVRLRNDSLISEPYVPGSGTPSRDCTETAAR
ncbi:VCBS repeat-containing protein [Rhodovulum sp. DZ06]|uniref:VCBS repeat-containing protein n=1 Tax=Rhodovulum sp. DZ06 TaxID=3425126 RepID=UPI003D34FB2E